MRLRIELNEEDPADALIIKRLANLTSHQRMDLLRRFLWQGFQMEAGFIDHLHRGLSPVPSPGEPPPPPPMAAPSAEGAGPAAPPPAETADEGSKAEPPSSPAEAGGGEEAEPPRKPLSGLGGIIGD